MTEMDNKKMKKEKSIEQLRIIVLVFCMCFIALFVALFFDGLGHIKDFLYMCYMVLLILFLVWLIKFIAKKIDKRIVERTEKTQTGCKKKRYAILPVVIPSIIGLVFIWGLFNFEAFKYNLTMLRVTSFLFFSVAFLGSCFLWAIKQIHFRWVVMTLFFLIWMWVVFAVSDSLVYEEFKEKDTTKLMVTQND